MLKLKKIQQTCGKQSRHSVWELNALNKIADARLITDKP